MCCWESGHEAVSYLCVYGEEWAETGELSVCLWGRVIIKR